MVQTKVHDNFLKEWQEKFREKSSKALWKQFRENLWKKFQDKLETFKKLLKNLGETLLEISGITPGEILKKKQSCENIWEKSKTRKNFWKYFKSNFGRSFTTPATTSKAILGVFFLTGGTQGKISLMPLIMESWKKNPARSLWKTSGNKGRNLGILKDSYREIPERIAGIL